MNLEAILNNEFTAEELEAIKRNQNPSGLKADLTFGPGYIEFPGGKVVHTAPAMALVLTDDGIEVVDFHGKEETK